MQLTSILKDCKITLGLTNVAAGTSAQSTSALDMSGFDGVIFIAVLNTVVDGSVLTLTAYDNATNTNSGGTAVTGGATNAVTAATSSNTVIVLDVIRPAGRYVYATLTRTAQNATIGGIIAIQYKGKGPDPITQGATVLASALSTPES